MVGRERRVGRDRPAPAALRVTCVCLRMRPSHVGGRWWAFIHSAAGPRVSTLRSPPADPAANFFRPRLLVAFTGTKPHLFLASTWFLLYIRFCYLAPSRQAQPKQGFRGCVKFSFDRLSWGVSGPRGSGGRLRQQPPGRDVAGECCHALLTLCPSSRGALDCWLLPLGVQR